MAGRRPSEVAEPLAPSRGAHPAHLPSRCRVRAHACPSAGRDADEWSEWPAVARCTLPRPSLTEGAYSLISVERRGAKGDERIGGLNFYTAGGKEWLMPSQRHRVIYCLIIIVDEKYDEMMDEKNISRAIF